MQNPIVIATWPFGLPACQAAWDVLSAGGAALDGVEAGATYCEDDPAVDSVGFGGLPDASGEVTLDASIMDHTGRCGAVACLRRVRHATKVARMVMERTPHVMLVGEAATQFAIGQGMKESDLLSDEAARQYEQWKLSREQNVPKDGHDTIGILALDAAGRIAGACTTSGLKFKLPGRVGDSPIIGAGLYVDGAVGAATATGVGEEMIKSVASFAAIENMRRGMEPLDAIRDVLERVLRRRGGDAETDVCLIVLRRDGVAAGMSLRGKTNFKYAVVEAERRELVIAPSIVA
ncbi:MAG: N(4)-(Beta-N-acetylglucosaminyl)-L-asparaginase precursor [Phycisphaerales bacterium]|nr:N(4)-(Beta-N-acetylglucosaminyl)-L-asparaginase precursor [Phycisphaerales bacterium]